MKNSIVMLFILGFVVSSCEKEDFKPQCLSNQGESKIEKISTVPGKIIKVNDVFCITIDSESVENSGYIVGSNNILVPCNMNEEFKVLELKVIVSGYKTNYCNALSLPWADPAFGCEFEITSIKKM